MESRQPAQASEGAKVAAGTLEPGCPGGRKGPVPQLPCGLRELRGAALCSAQTEECLPQCAVLVDEPWLYPGR